MTHKQFLCTFPSFFDPLPTKHHISLSNDRCPFYVNVFTHGNSINKMEDWQAYQLYTCHCRLIPEVIYGMPKGLCACVGVALGVPFECVNCLKESIRKTANLCQYGILNILSSKQSNQFPKVFTIDLNQTYRICILDLHGKCDYNVHAL